MQQNALFESCMHWKCPSIIESMMSSNVWHEASKGKFKIVALTYKWLLKGAKAFQGVHWSINQWFAMTLQQPNEPAVKWQNHYYAIFSYQQSFQFYYQNQ